MWEYKADVEVSEKIRNLEHKNILKKAIMFFKDKYLNQS